MYQFLSRRLLLLVPVIFGITFVTFALARILPGDPCYSALGERATLEQCNAYREREGLNDSIPVQFGRYLNDILHGNFGESLKDRRPVMQIMLERLPMTLEVTLGAMLFSTTFGVLLGVISAVRRNTAVDVGTMIGANIGVSMPVFWLGLMLAYVFAIMLKDTPFWIPPSGRLSSGLSIPPLAETYNLQNLSGIWGAIVTFASNTVTFNALITGNFEVLRDALWHLILPCVAVGTIPLSIIARMTRSSLLEVFGLDYIRTARAKGLRERAVILKHAMRNAMLPIVTVIGLSVGALMSGAVLTETVFALPGVGTQLVRAILSRDYAVVQAFTVVVALIFVFINLIVDFSYVFLDPPYSDAITALMTSTAAPLQLEALTTVKSRTPLANALRRFSRHRSARVGMAILGFLILVAIFAPLLAPHDPLKPIRTAKRRSPPCIHLMGCPADQPQHFFGIDSNQRDLLSRIIYGSRLSLAIGLATVSFAIIIGTVLGALGGFAGGWTDNIIMRFMDVLLAFPSLLLSIAIVAVLGPGLINALIAIAFVSIPVYARIVRASVLQVKEQDFVSASRALGASPLGILIGHVLPNAITPLIVQATLGIASAILDAAALSFLGLGAAPPTPEWGLMLGEERNSVFNAPHLVFIPGIAIMLTVLGFNLVGDGLRDALDPRLVNVS